MDCIDPTKTAKEGEDPFSNRIVLRMMDVYRLAVQFHMARLEHLCVQYLHATICLKNVLEALHNAHNLKLDFIKEFCLKFIVKDTNYNQIVMSEEFEKLERGLIVEIIRRKQQPQNKGPNEKQFQSAGSSLEQDMAMFLVSTGKEFCDIDLILDSHVISAHKSVLAARCGYFEAMFRSFMPSDNKVRVRSVCSQYRQPKPQYNFFSDSNRGNNAISSFVRVSAPLHLFRRCEHASGRFALSILRSLLLRFHQ